MASFWNDTIVSTPLVDIQRLADDVFRRKGMGDLALVFTHKAFDAFRNHPEVGRLANIWKMPICLYDPRQFSVPIGLNCFIATKRLKENPEQEDMPKLVDGFIRVMDFSQEDPSYADLQVVPC